MMNKNSLDWAGAVQGFGFQAGERAQTSLGQRHDVLRKGNREG